MNAADNSAPFAIAQLPDELFLEILEYLRPIRGFQVSPPEEEARQYENGRRVKALHALALACLRIHILVQPFLYQCFIQPDRDRRATRFLQTILHNPSLATGVQYIESLRPNRPPTKIECQTKEAPPSYLRRSYHILQNNHWQDRVRANLLHGQFTTILQEYETRGNEIEIATIVALSPNLVELAVTEPSQLLLATLHMKSYSNNSGLQSVWIKSLPEFNLRTPKYWFQGTVFQPCIPVGRQLWLGGANESPYHSRGSSMWLHPHPMAENIEEIVLDTCEIAPWSLHSLLFSRAGLKRFTCRWGKHPDATTRPQAIRLPALRESLIKHSSTLESLVLDTLESNWQVRMDMDIPPIGSLRDFVSLKKLDVSGLVLWGDHDDEACEHDSLATILPGSLEHLAIRNEWDVHLNTFLCDFPENGPSPFPNLKYLDCSWRPIDKHDAEWMISILASCGVQLQVHASEDT
jgi:hypothetical protein